MELRKLYRFKREDGGVTVSTIESGEDYEITYRVIADEGKVLTDGENYFNCIDTDTPDNFTEVEDTTPSLLES